VSPQDLLRETIDQQFINPKKKFDTIYDEYIDKQKQYDHLRSAVNQESGDSVKQETDMLKIKLEVLKKTQAIELKHAKLTAKNEADKMLKEKLNQAKLAYEIEFDSLCKQYDNIKNDVRVLI
jgi:hypothetical protein